METGKYKESNFKKGALTYPINRDYTIEFYTYTSTENKVQVNINVIIYVLHRNTNMVYCITTYNFIKPLVKDNEYNAEYLDFINKAFVEFDNYLKEDENIDDVKLYTKDEIKIILDLRKNKYKSDIL